MSASTVNRFLGFDTIYYPGDAAMAAWKQHSPYVFAGYYLKAPCRRDGTYRGKRATMQSMGWNCVPIYVGRQAQGPCSSGVLSAPFGAQHGLDAIAQASAEGFPRDTSIYLDVEYVDRVSAALRDYIQAWMETVRKGPFAAAMYCHASNAKTLREIAMKDWPAGTAAPRFWVAGGRRPFDRERSLPADSGVPFATMWQGVLNIKETHGGRTILIDVNSSTLADPAAPGLR